MLSLSQMVSGQKVCLVSSGHVGSMSRRLQELGFVPGTVITCLGAAPAGSPLRYDVRGCVVALRKNDAASVLGEEL